MRVHATSITISATALVLLAGCEQGAATYDVSGTVTFKGEPVPAGQISFEPDTAQGNSGPIAVGQIDNGKFQTDSDRGAVAGPHRVIVVGKDGIQAGDGPPDGRALFPAYTTSIDLPADDSTQDFDVPAQR